MRTIFKLWSLVLKEWQESLGIFILALILFLMNFGLAFSIPNYDISVYRTFQIFIVSISFSFIFGAYSWSHEHSRGTSEFLSSLPVDRHFINRAKFIAYMIYSLILPSVILILGLGTIVLEKQHVILIALVVIIFPLTFIICQRMNSVLLAIGLSLLLLPLYFYLLWLEFLCSASLFWPHSPYVVLTRFITNNLLLIQLVLGVLVMFVAFFLNTTMMKKLIFLLLIVPFLFLTVSLLLVSEHFSRFHNNYPDPKFFFRPPAQLPKKDKNEAAIDFFDVYQPSTNSESGTLLMKIHTGVIEIDKNKQSATLFYLPYSNGRTALFIEDGKGLIYTSYSPLERSVKNWFLVYPRFWSPYFWGLPTYEGFSKCLWVWRRDENTIRPLDISEAAQAFSISDGKVILNFGLWDNINIFDPETDSMNSATVTFTPSDPDEKYSRYYIIGYDSRGKTLYFQEDIVPNWGALFKFPLSTQKLEPVTSGWKLGHSPVFFIPQGSGNLILSYNGTLIDISSNENQTPIIEGTIGTAFGGCPKEIGCLDNYPYLLCTFEDKNKYLRLYRDDATNDIWRRECDYIFAKFSPRRKFLF